MVNNNVPLSGLDPAELFVLDLLKRDTEFMAIRLPSLIESATVRSPETTAVKEGLWTVREGRAFLLGRDIKEYVQASIPQLVSRLEFSAIADKVLNTTNGTAEDSEAFDGNL